MSIYQSSFTTRLHQFTGLSVLPSRSYTKVFTSPPPPRVPTGNHWNGFSKGENPATEKGRSVPRTRRATNCESSVPPVSRGTACIVMTLSEIVKTLGPHCRLRCLARRSADEAAWRDGTADIRRWGGKAVAKAER